MSFGIPKDIYSMSNCRRNAFTMIELVFIIVIIGILASVAIPKFLLHRENAIVIQMIENLKTFTQDVKNYYQANGEDLTANPTGTWGVATYDKVSDVLDHATAATVTTGGTASFNIGNQSGEQCFTVTEGTQQVTLNGQQITQRTITISDGPDKTKPVCAIALQVADQKGLHTKGVIETIVFAGTRSSF